MDIATFSVNRKILVNMLFFILVFLGIGLYRQMPREFFPNMHLDEALIIVTYPGASPLEVEQQILDKIEDAVAELDGLDEVRSRAQNSVAVVELLLEEGTDVDKFMLDMQAAVNNIPDLPDDAEDPVYLELDSSAIAPVCFIAIGGEVREPVLLEIAEDLKQDIIDIRGVKKVDIDGMRDDEVHINVDPVLLDHHGLALADVVAALAARNVDLPAGSAELGRSEYTLRVLGKFRDVAEIEDTVLRQAEDGNVVRLGQVAEAVLEPEEQEAVNRLNGEPAGTLYVYKKDSGDAIRIMEQVRLQVERYNATLPLPVNLEIRADTSELVEERLGIMTNNAVLTAVLVGAFLFVFLGWTNALLVLVGIPFTFLTAFLFMSAADMSVNMLTLFALIMALGMIVDDAIVVVDNIQRYIEFGLPPREAAIRGTKEVMAPVTAAVLTTVAGFTPMLFMTGMIGKFMEAIPLTVIFALLASLVEALLILPSHSAELNELYRKLCRRFGRRGKHEGPAAGPCPADEEPAAALAAPAENGLKGGVRLQGRQNFLFRRLRRIYRRQLILALRYRYLGVVSVVVLAFLCLGLLRQIPVKMFGDEDFDQFVIRYELPQGTPLAETALVTRAVERIVEENVPPEERKGIVSSSGYQIVNYEYIRGSHRAEVTVDLVSAADRERSDMEIMAGLRGEIARVPGIRELHLVRPESGPPTGRPVEIRVVGSRFEVLESLGEIVKAELARIDGVVDIADDFDRTAMEYLVEVDEDRARALGLSNIMVARTVSAAFQGMTATEYTDPDGAERDVVVRLDDRYRDDLETLDLLKVQSMSGGLVPLSSLARFAPSNNFSSIRHFERERAITITAELEGGQTSAAVNEEIARKFANFSLDHPGYRLEYGGEYERTTESFRSLFLMLPVALLAIFMILATQFNSLIQPFVVLFTVPFSFIGVVIGLLVMGYNFSIPAMVGIISLMGLVVNNSLVMVDFINKSRTRGVGRWFSIVRSGVVRMRPILLTTITTIVGLSSLTIATTGASKVMVPMAVSMIWGLAFATVLTLFLIPALIGIVDDVNLRFRFGRSWDLYGRRS